MHSDKALFKISVVVGDKVEELLVHGDDCPEIICEEFAKTHKLSEKGQKELLTGINSCIDELAKSLNEPSQNSNSPVSKSSTNIFSRLSQPKFSNQDRSPSLQLLESANSTQKRYHLLCKHKKQAINTFKPELSKKTIQLISSGKIFPTKKTSHKCIETQEKSLVKQRKFNEEQGKQVANRLIGYLKVKEKKINELRTEKEIEQSEFFKPCIIKRPKSVKSPENKKKPGYKFNNEKFRKFLNFNVKEGPSRSTDIIEGKKKKRFKEIFKILSPNSDVLQIRNICFDKLDKELLRIICPLLEELAEVDSGLEFQDFLIAMNNLMNVLTVAEKSVVLDTKKKNSYKSTHFSFKPETCTSLFNIKSNLLERSSLLLTKKEQLYKQGQEAKIASELSSCTFAPKTTKFIRSIFSPS